MSNNKIAIVTGGNRGIGLGITQSFIEGGYNVLVGARQDRNLEETNRRHTAGRGERRVRGARAWPRGRPRSPGRRGWRARGRRAAPGR